MAENYYSVLGVSPEASQEEIKKAYRQAAIKNHPDRGGEQERMVQVNEAYAILGDPALRAEYDRFRATAMNDQQAAEWRQKTAPVRTAARRYPSKWSDFEKWVDGFVVDVRHAKYGSEKIFGDFSMPKIGDSLSGLAFCWAGAILGAVVIGGFLGVYPAMHRVWVLGEPGVGPVGQFLETVGKHPNPMMSFGAKFVYPFSQFLAVRGLAISSTGS